MKRITELKLGKYDLGGPSDIYRVLDIRDGEATMFFYAGDAHRVERMSIDDAILLLNMLLEPDIYEPDYEAIEQEMDAYWSTEHPECRIVAMWPDDCDYDDWTDAYKGCHAPDGYAIDIETGELYNDAIMVFGGNDNEVLV